jgi:hypothetical protein
VAHARLAVMGRFADGDVGPAQLWRVDGCSQLEQTAAQGVVANKVVPILP